MYDDLKLVYTGSRVEGIFLKELLEKNNITVMFTDTLSASVIAGWADGSPEDTIQIQVTNENAHQAEKILNDYFASRNDK
jgi:hypothetical protein